MFDLIKGRQEDTHHHRKLSLTTRSSHCHDGAMLCRTNCILLAANTSTHTHKRRAGQEVNKYQDRYYKNAILSIYMATKLSQQNAIKIYNNAMLPKFFYTTACYSSTGFPMKRCSDFYKCICFVLFVGLEAAKSNQNPLY